ncbi:hypothetical protein AGLY_017564, partial [Aphis glycines]
QPDAFAEGGEKGEEKGEVTDKEENAGKEEEDKDEEQGEDDEEGEEKQNEKNEEKYEDKDEDEDEDEEEKKDEKDEDEDEEEQEDNDDERDFEYAPLYEIPSEEEYEPPPSHEIEKDPVSVIEPSLEDEITSDTERERQHKRPAAVLKSESKRKPKDDMPKNRMPITQKLLLGFDINTTLKYCPLCDYVSMEKLKRHVARMHSNSIQEPVGENIDKLLSLESKSCKLVRLSMVRELMGGKLWWDLNVRKALHRLFQMFQIKLWQGNWLIPGVPTVDHLSPYVKKEYLDDFYEQMEAEIYDDTRYDEKTIYPPILTTETTAATTTTAAAAAAATTTIKDTKVTERQTLDDSVDDILENLPLTESKQ